MIADKWVDRFMRLAAEVSTWSKDPQCQVGAVLADKKEVVSLGYNGPISEHNDKEVLALPNKNDYIVHAEINALRRSWRYEPLGSKFQLYVTKAPCMHCAERLCPHVDAVYIPTLHSGSKWYQEQLNAVKLFQREGIKVYYVEFHFDARGNRTISINDAEVFNSRN